MLRGGEPTSEGGGGMKSESTKTNVPAVTERRCSTRWARERVSQSGGALKSSDSRPLVLELEQLPLDLRWAPVEVAVRLVEIADEASGQRRSRGRARRCDASPAACRAMGAAHGKPPSRSAVAPRPSAPPPRTARARRTRRSPCRRDPRGGRPVDRVHVVARAIRASRYRCRILRRLRIVPKEMPITPRRGTSGNVSRALATPSRRVGALEEADPPRSPGAARSRGRRGTLRSPPTSRWRAPSRRNSACRRRGARGQDEEPFHVLGDDEGPAVDERPCAGGSLEREAAANGAPVDRLAPRVARTRSTTQRWRTSST